MASLFESYERRIDNINAVLAQYGIKSIEEAKSICDEKGIDPYKMCEETQPICFENAKWAYVVGAAIAIKKGCTTAADAAEAIGEGLQAFCIAGSVADDRKVGIGHGNLAARLLREDTQCFAFLAGHESFAAAEGAIKIAEMANRVRKNPLRVILSGQGCRTDHLAYQRLHVCTHRVRLLLGRSEGVGGDTLLGRSAFEGSLLRCRRCTRGRSNHVERGCRRIDYR